MVKLSKLICIIWKHKWDEEIERRILNNFTGETIIIKEQGCLRCGEVKRSKTVLPPKKSYRKARTRRLSGRLQPPPKRKVGLKPRSAFEKRMWKKSAKLEEEED